VNDDVLAFLERQNLNLNSVVENNRIVNLSAKTGRFYGGYTREMLPEVHPKMHSYFEQAGKIVDIPIAGFDLIIDDPTKDPDEQRWGIIECNSMPFIDLHYFSLEGEHINIAKNVWDLWLKK
jgi:cyanophycin synthetase